MGPRHAMITLMGPTHAPPGEAARRYDSEGARSSEGEVYCFFVVNGLMDRFSCAKNGGGYKSQVV